MTASTLSSSRAAAALRRLSPERSTPAFALMIRWRSGRRPGLSTGITRGGADGTGVPSRCGPFSTTSSAIRSAKTRPSRSEFEASRLAPWTPVQATSPHAYRPGTVVRPYRSVRTPPEA